MISADNLVDAFEAGEIDNSAFPHEHHVRVAWGLVQRYPREEAFERLAAGIRDMAARAGKPDAYHATITRAWFDLIAGAESLDRFPELFDKALLSRYYSPGRLSAGRDSWLDPDLQPLRLPAPAAPAAEADPRTVLRNVPSSVAILATKAGETVHATTVSSFAPVSRDPALVSVCLDSNSHTLVLLRAARGFTLSILASGQEDIASHFARRDRPAGVDQFAGIQHHLTERGPMLDIAAAWIGCGLHALYECGDHHIVIGRVEHAHAGARSPLLRHNGSYASPAPAP